jgi:hypothetical protein
MTFGYRVSDIKLSTNAADEKCELSVPLYRDVKPRRMMYRKLPYGATPDRAPAHVDTNDIETQVAGLKHRICRLTPFVAGQDTTRLLAEFNKFVKDWCAQHLEPLNKIPDFESWLGSTSYPLTRKDQLRKIFEDLHGDAPTLKQRRKIASFIKSECYPEFKHARWINSRSDHFKAYSGPWFKAIEERVFELPWFIKHVPVPDRAAKVAGLMREGARYYATDFTSFEAHFHPKFMANCEGILYSHMLRMFPKQRRIILETIFGINHGRTRRGVSFRLKGRRMSGDMCTSLGNGFSNLMIWAFLSHKRGVTWDGFVEGDDGIFAVYKGEGPQKEEYTKLGFTVKIEEGNDPRIMSFCGIIAADNQNLRDPAKFLNSFGWTSSHIYAGHKVLCELLRAKALSAAYETPHCPIIRAIADRALYLTRNYYPRFVDDGYHKLPEDSIPPFAPTPTTREMFARLYSIPVPVQRLAEDRIRSGCDLRFLDTLIPIHRDIVRFSSFFVERK